MNKLYAAIASVLVLGWAGSASAQYALGSTNASGTVTAGGTWQTAVAQNSNRKGCLIQNPIAASEPLYVYFGPKASALVPTATAGNAFGLVAGASMSCDAGGLSKVGDEIAVTAATTGHAYVINSQ